jgi:hypothetical protein
LSDGAAAIRPTTEPLAHLEQLEKAVAHEWLLAQCGCEAGDRGEAQRRCLS